MQIHFGMSGAFRLMAKDKIREERETTRLVLQNKGEQLLAHLSAMTVQYGGPGRPLLANERMNEQLEPLGYQACKCVSEYYPAICHVCSGCCSQGWSRTDGCECHGSQGAGRSGTRYVRHRHASWCRIRGSSCWPT